jgi:NTE family protein
MAAVVGVLVAACSGAQQVVPLPARQCVVLSVGGPAGLAHAGVLAELQRQNVPIDCVVGNSMGAVVGSLYAAEPQVDPVARTRAFLGHYLASVGDDLKQRAAIGALLGCLLGPWGCVAGGAAGAATIDKLEHGRFVRVLDDYLERRDIRQLRLPFATFYQRLDGDGLALVDAVAGNTAQAVGWSAANPFIFEGLDVRKAQGIDPGGDRLSAAPASDACRLFPDARLLVVNVSGQPLAVRRDVGCPILEVTVPRLHDLNADDVARGGKDYLRLVEAGRQAAAKALGQAPKWRLAARQ